MVDSLDLQRGGEGDPLEMSCRAERGLDSPDSGLPPSPSPSAWLLPVSADKAGAASPVQSFLRLQPLSFGEGISLDPLPAKAMRYTSSLHYDSSRHFIQDVALRPWGQGLERCSQTVMATPNSTWRHYKTQLELQPRYRVQRFQSTAIIYPKHAHAVYTTELSYDGHRRATRFLSSVELEAAGGRKRQQ
ncbi:refilin-B [Genypterus blacodes]|uniref:refilin-B n=1 Tax=Genypterus blacodes TaxID=154954 RepID=UPI003F7687A0